ncbi:hemoglobin subunit alpha-2-like [Eleutherodactylus coqui]|uniref:Globin domain-containing protein n=1 Tax=Eleutherodactylus coqui TaxID=57060 RepID=A0A8J6K2Q7_ELECQ|nr:hypothetical protein GDO78_002506 [Eleutherodactylus coqui]
MALTADDKAHIQAIWPCVAAHPAELGGEALHRMFVCHPKTKTYFPGFDFHKDSAQIKAHGKKVVNALTEASHHLDNIPGALSKLSDLHAYDLRVDPGNFDHLRHHILVTMGCHFPDKLDCCTHQSMDKFLAAVGNALTSKYR